MRYLDRTLLSYAVLVAAVMLPAAALAQAPSDSLRPGSVAVLDVALYTAGANVQESADTGRATLATGVLRGTLDSLLGPALAASAAVQRAAGDPAMRAISGDQPCNVIVACARAVGRAVGADWVVMAKVSKTSNLIWLLTSQLIRVGSGEIVLDDSTELKGDPAVMIRAGVRIFGERVARAVRDRARKA